MSLTWFKFNLDRLFNLESGSLARAPHSPSQVPQLPWMSVGFTIPLKHHNLASRSKWVGEPDYTPPTRHPVWPPAGDCRSADPSCLPVDQRHHPVVIVIVNGIIIYAIASLERCGIDKFKKLCLGRLEIFLVLEKLSYYQAVLHWGIPAVLRQGRCLRLGYWGKGKVSDWGMFTSQKKCSRPTMFRHRHCSERAALS